MWKFKKWNTKEKSTPTIHPFIQWLTLCQSHGYRLTFGNPTLNDEEKHLYIHELSKTLTLSGAEEKTLKKHLLSNTPPHEGIAAIYRAIKKQRRVFPCQVCETCAPTLFTHYGHLVADNSWCSQCYQKSDCIDAALIEHYHQHGIDDDTILSTLPRLRWGAMGRPAYQSIEEIESAYEPVFTAARKKSNKDYF